MSVCILNITIKIELTIGFLIILQSQIKPTEVMNEFARTMPNKNVSIE